MSTPKIHKDTPLKLLSENRIERYLKPLSPNLKSVGLKNSLLTLKYNQMTIILPLTLTMNWGQLIDSLKEEGLIHESN